MPSQYGRGKFVAHPNYIRYMEEIVKDNAYLGMPNAIGVDGHINWQVSSGKTTSFYRFYEARFTWWVSKADQLGIPGEGNSNDRFSITARLIHPTGLRPCRLCGNYLSIGYMYLNAGLATKFNKLTNSNAFHQKQDIGEATASLINFLGIAKTNAILQETFRSRSPSFEFKSIKNLEDVIAYFQNTKHVKGPFLSPGFMANPPDRLDGFHDYGICCRKERDPGRSDENMRTYNHDRRAFQWWTEGDWKLADALYNSATLGTCIQCKKEVDKISPHHIGPLACGFKQMPFFMPLCGSCNSSINRRMRIEEVNLLKEYEHIHKESVASWQIKKFWDEIKENIKTKHAAKEISNILRSIEDYYLRTLFSFWQNGNAHFISSFLSPQYAHYSILFNQLSASTLTFTGYNKTCEKTKGSTSLAARSVRIAFEELEAYCLKKVKERKITKLPIDSSLLSVGELLVYGSEVAVKPYSEKWLEAVKTSSDFETKERRIANLLDNNYDSSILPYQQLKIKLQAHFDNVGGIVAQAYKKSKI